MNRLSSKLLIVGCLIAAVSFTLSTQGKERKKKASDPAARIKKKLAAAELPADVLAKANKVVDEQAPQLKEAQAKIDAALTSEQKQARAQAQKAAKESGQKGKQAKAAAESAMKLTTEQKSKLAEAEKEMAAAQAAVQRSLREVLTADQLAKAGIKSKKKKA
jgi:ectoine hydroxylase-related dioxygenase (phytanoyl-CoA dioxygenase family)